MISPKINCVFFFKLIYFYFWLRWVFVAAHGLSLVAASGGYSSLQCVGFSLRWLLLLWSTGSRHAGFSSYGTWAQQLWHMGLAAPQHVGSSQTRARTRVSCIGRQIPNHCTTREVQLCIFYHNFFLHYLKSEIIKNIYLLFTSLDSLFPSSFPHKIFL